MPYFPPPSSSSAAATTNPNIMQPASSVTLTDGYSLVVVGEYVLDSNIELTVGGSGGLTEVFIE